jgi:hypothetical protein
MDELIGRRTVYVPRGSACRKRVVIVERKLRAVMRGRALLDTVIDRLELLAVLTNCVAVFPRVDARAATYAEHGDERDQS